MERRKKTTSIEPDYDAEARRKLFGQILKECNLVTDEQIQEAIKIQRQKGGLLGDILIHLGYVNNEQILNSLGMYLGMKVVKIDNAKLPPDVIEKLPASIARIYRIIPISYNDGVLEVAQENVLKIEQLHDINLLLGYKIRGVICEKADISRAIEKYYPDQYESIDDLLQEAGVNKASGEVGKEGEVIELDVEELKRMADTAPVKSFVNAVLLQAITEMASDIHFEPFEDEFFVRYRVDNLLYRKATPPISLGMAITTRLKVMAELDITEKRIPQDGRIKLRIRGNCIEFRISCLPTKFGESVVLRIFDKSVASMDIRGLGLVDDENALMTKLLKAPNGIILVTGPTGSGKTTTLYSILNSKNRPDVKIITTEDPVENEIDGIMQITINPDTGTTFATSLRAILRQDPDIILVGEIRDEETAQIAVQAALTGHLVLSTLHTNDSPSTITRLVDMGIPPFMISATLRAVISQRLIRKICPECKEECEVDDALLSELDISREEIKANKFYRGTGCENCRNTGYKGRMAIFEIMEMNDEISSLVISRASTAEIRSAARKNGMRTLRESGLRAASNGLTTLEQVVNETVVE